MALLEAIRTRIIGKRQVVVSSYLELVHAVADDAEYDDLRAVEILAAAGKSLADLENDVTYVKQRKAFKSQLDAIPSLEIAKAANLVPLQELDAKILALQTERDAIRPAILGADLSFMGRIAQGPVLKRRLHDGYRGYLDPAGIDRKAEVEKERASIRKRRKFRDELLMNRKPAAHAVDLYGRQLENKRFSPAQRVGLQTDYDRAVNLVRDYDSQIAELDRLDGIAERRASELEAGMLLA